MTAVPIPAGAYSCTHMPIVPKPYGAITAQRMPRSRAFRKTGVLHQCGILIPLCGMGFGSPVDPEERKYNTTSVSAGMMEGTGYGEGLAATDASAAEANRGKT